MSFESYINAIELPVKMKDYEYLDHTADAKFRAYGADLEEAFKNAALASFNIICKTEDIKPKIIKKINIIAKRKESLLYDFLEELLFFLDVDGFVLHEIIELNITKTKKEQKINKETEEIDVYELFAKINGDYFKDYDLHGNIKSVTYNDMFIKEEDNKITIQVVLDM